MTSAHGAANVGKGDWSALDGRDVILWPDRDAAGRKCARAVVTLLLKRDSCRRVRVIESEHIGKAVGVRLDVGDDAADVVESVNEFEHK